MAESGPYGTYGRILLVADNSSATTAVETLGALGHALLTVEGFEAARSILDRERPDLVAVEVAEGIGGRNSPTLTFLRSIKADQATAHIPVVIFGPTEEIHLVTTHLEAGAIDHVGAVDSPLFGARVAQHLERVRLSKIVERDNAERMSISHAVDPTIDRRGSGRDAPTLDQSVEFLQRQAYRDQLTGLPNRLALITLLEERRHNTGEAAHALIVLDCDRFSVVNDSYGHEITDRVIVAIADRLVQRVPSGWYIARIGGDEFAILTPDLPSVEAVMAAAEQATKVFDHPFAVGEHELRISASMGVAMASAATSDPEELLRNADMAMHRAKRKSGTTTHLYTDELGRALRARISLENQLRQAAHRSEFRTLYQPIFDLRTGMVSGFEALVRWEHPDRGPIAPDVFMPIAEETGIAVDIGTFILAESVQQIAKWRRRNPSDADLTVNVNLSTNHLRHPELTSQVADILTSADVEPAALKIEITESALMDDPDAAIAILGQLNRTGCRLVLDDFGTGFSSLSYLRILPVHELKVDRSFVSHVRTDIQCEIIVAAIIQMATRLGLRVTVEGIEDLEQLEALRRLGAHTGQGYLFSRPGTAEDMERLLVQNPLY